MERLVEVYPRLAAGLAAAVDLGMTQARTQQRNADLLVGVFSRVLVVEELLLVVGAALVVLVVVLELTATAVMVTLAAEAAGAQLAAQLAAQRSLKLAALVEQLLVALVIL